MSYLEIIYFSFENCKCKKCINFDIFFVKHESWNVFNQCSANKKVIYSYDQNTLCGKFWKEICDILCKLNLITTFGISGNSTLIFSILFGSFWN